MLGHVNDWLGAYLDGELSGGRRRQVKQHLEACAECRQALADQQRLSSILQRWEAPPLEIPVERATANVKLRLARLPDRKPPQPVRVRALRAIWQMAPLLLLIGWAFGQAVAVVSNLVLAAQTVASGDSGAVIWGAMGAFTGGFDLLGHLAAAVMQAGEAFSPASLGNTLLAGFSLNLGVTVLTGLLFASWLASWLVYQRQAGLVVELDI